MTKMGMKPFLYGLKVTHVFDGEGMLDPAVLDMDPDKPLFGMVTANLIPCGFASTTSSAGGKSKGLTATKVTTSKLSKTASTGKIAMPIHSFKKPKKP